MAFNYSNMKPSEVSHQPNAISRDLFSTVISGNARMEADKPAIKVDYSKYKITSRKNAACQEKVTGLENVGEVAESDSRDTSCSSSSCSSSISAKPGRQEATKQQVSKRKHAATIQEHGLEMMLKSRKEQTKIYSGKKKETQEGERQPLREITKPAAKRARNEDDQFLKRIREQFPEKADKPKREGKTWQDVYGKLVARKERKDAEKLAEVTSRIEGSKAKKENERQAIVIDVAHRMGRRGGARAPKMVETVKGADLSKARKSIGEGIRSKMEAPVAAAIRKTKADPKKKKPEQKVYAPMMKQCRRDFKLNPWH